MIYIKKSGEIIDSIRVLSEYYSRCTLIDSSVYYTDHIFAPDIIYLKLHHSKIEGNKLLPPETVKLNSIDLFNERLTKLKFKSDELILMKKSEGTKIKNTYNIDSIFSK